MGVDDAPLGDVAPRWLSAVFERLWSWITGTKVGVAVFIAITYVIPYGLAALAIVTQIKSGGEFALLAASALVASTFASAQPAPTPAMGTLSMVLAGFMGAYFDPLIVGAAAGAVGTFGLVVSYGVGATGIGRLLFARLQGRPVVLNAIRRAFDAIKRFGAWAILVLSFVPNPLYAWSSVAAGTSRVRFGGFLIAAGVGNVARFTMVAFIGVGIEKILS